MTPERRIAVGFGACQDIVADGIKVRDGVLTPSSRGAPRVFRPSLSQHGAVLLEHPQLLTHEQTRNARCTWC